jgi:TonB-linked SusC/RagA family outer membrane protein
MAYCTTSSSPGRPSRPLLACLLFFLALSPARADAQTGRIQGLVTDETNGRPLVGAQVLVVGTGLGGLTNADGRYALGEVPVGERTVEVQLLGYGQAQQTVQVPADGTVTADFQLGASAIALDEVVVTGQGRAVERRQLSTTITVINEAEIRNAPVTSIDQLLQGRVPGATVSMVSAQPGTAGLINFRGVKSVFSAQTPVIYVDGVRVDNDMSTAMGTGGEQSSALAELLTSDIERVEVIRGGAASTLYGSDAANGVIQVFTRKGQPGMPRVNVRVEQGIDVPELKYMFDTQLSFADQVESGEIPANYLRDNFFRNGHFQNYGVTVSGGQSAFTYNVGGRVQRSEGVQPYNTNTLFSLRGGVQAMVSDRVNLDFSGSYTRNNFGRIFNGTAIADPLTSFEVGDAFFFTEAETVDEALRIFLLPEIDEYVDRFIFSTAASYRPMELISTRFSVGLDNRTNEQRIYQPIGFIPGERTGELDRFDRSFNSVTLEATGTLSYPREGSVTSNLTLGAQGFREAENTISATGTTFALPGAPDIDEAATITAAETRSEIFNGGFFVQEQLGIADRLFLEGGMRFDYNSAFGEDVGVEAYPKAGASYVLSSEPMFESALGSIVDELKLRAAYGRAGKFPQPFLKDRTFNATSFRGESAPRFDNPGNIALGPEVTSTWEAGFDAAFLANRVGVGFTYYDAVTDDALFFVPEPPLTGQGTQLRNVGQITNRGIELDAHVQVLNLRDVTWWLRATYQQVDNEVTDMSGASPFFVEGQKHVCGPPHDCELGEGKGRPVGAWFVTTPIDTNGDGRLDNFERRYTGGEPSPTSSGGFSTDITLFNRLSLSASADWARGHQVMDWGSVWASFNQIFRREELECGGTLEGCAARFPIRHDLDGNPILDDDGNPVRFSQSQARTEFLYDGDYFKLREIGARYQVPPGFAERVGLERAMVFASVRNVAIFSKNRLIDPELNGIAGGGLALGGESSVTLSPPRQFRFGLEISF